MKKPERELVGREIKRVKQSVKPAKVRNTSTSGFRILGRTLFIAGPLALIVLVVATFFTPMLAIEQIKVSGHERIKASKVPVHVPLSGKTMSFDGRGKCTVGC